jgi:uncharacterized membrane protein
MDKIQFKLTQSARSFIYYSALGLSGLWLAWLGLSQVNFLYPIWYDLLDIHQTIETYGPQNRFKTGFALTDTQQHFQLFQQIVSAINNSGEGLNKIAYVVDGQHHPLLHQAEIAHLKDVAHLVSGLYWAGLFSLLLWLACLTRLIEKRAPLPRLNDSILLWLILIASLSIWVLLDGVKEVFYQLHTWIFPPENPWFFYYQDSLMSTLMKAPDLFAPLSLLLLLTSLSIAFAFGQLSYKLHTSLTRPSSKLTR